MDDVRTTLVTWCFYAALMIDWVPSTAGLTRTDLSLGFAAVTGAAQWIT